MSLHSIIAIITTMAHLTTLLISMEKYNTNIAVVLRGLLGLTTVQSVETITTGDITQVGDLVIKIVIAVVTIYGILKKSKQPTININNGEQQQ